MKKVISILTATRAEYGLLKPIIAKLNAEEAFDVRIVATGAHLSSEYGLTYREIEKDGFTIDEKIEILLSSDTAASVSKSMGLAMIEFSSYFERLKPDLLVVLGDRYETLAVAVTAMNQRIPIAHLYGGEATEGAIDDAIRHAITKLSYLHFTSIEPYRKRIIQLGEHPDRVYTVGAIGIENILNEKLLSREALARELGISLTAPYAVVTFHPVTLEAQSAEAQIQALLEACQAYQDLNFIFTKANADAEGRKINQMIDAYAQANAHIFAFTSLGMLKYLSALKYAALVMGNSSSGLLEAPSFGVPTINIGDRQRGRLQAESVLNCEPDQAQIKEAMDLALGDAFGARAKMAVNPYGDGHTSDRIVAVIKKYMTGDNGTDGIIDLKKKFYDCEVE
ncbi:MAG: hypothetical protein PWQ06_294 [Anaerophaga sp.]|jgi:GDP/UDP-N,N'-diacetylbacillosamine 2-epimerase (hydrolysing)|nr:hypothetical protein [Anaerophaga sp.]MDN5352804.1 hypothetical protein [Clostridiales bacterium]